MSEAAALGEDLTRRVAEAARLVGLQVDDRCAEVLGRLGPYLRHFAEMGLLLSRPVVAALSIGTGAAFRRTIAAQMAADGIPDATIATMEALHARIDDWMVARVDLVGPPPRSVAVYFRRLMPLSEVAGLLADHGVRTEASVALGRVAARLQTGRTPVFGVQFWPDRPPALKVYLRPQVDAATVASHLDALAEELHVCARHRRLLARSHAHLTAAGSSSLLVSLYFEQGAMAQALKVDYFCVALDALYALVAGLTEPAVALPSRRALHAVVGTDAAEHVGLRLSARGAAELSVYFPWSAGRPRC